MGYMMPLSYLISDQSLTYWEKLAFGLEPGLSKWPVELGRCKKVWGEGYDVIKSIGRWECYISFFLVILAAIFSSEGCVIPVFNSP